MAHYSVAQGGNKRNFPGWDNLFASGNTAGDIRYTPHHAIRQFHLPVEFNGTSSDWQSYFNMELPTKKPEVGDTFDWYWINGGTVIDTFVVHNKRPANVVLEFSVMNAAGTVVGTPVTADLNTVGFVNLGVVMGVPMPTNGALQVKLVSGDMREACFGTVVQLTDYASTQQCGCAPVVCDAEFPEPTCFSPTSGY